MPQQRKQVTVLFIHIDGLSTLAEEMGTGYLVDALWDRLSNAIQEHGGQANRPTGDNTIAVFGAPTAHEDDPERAVRAALSLLSELKVFSGEQKWATSLRLHIGVNTGPILFDTMKISGGFMAVGEAINIAGWLVRTLPEETVLIAHDTYRAVRGVFDVEALPPVTFPGRKEPLELYKVLREKPRAFHLGGWEVEGIETRLIGREGEIGQLQKAMQAAMAEKRTTAVTIIGETGAGKSRLLHEFTKWVELLPELYWLWQGRAGQENSRTPYALMRDLFATRFEIRDSDSTAVAQEKLEQGITQFMPEEGVAAAHFIGQLLGFDFSQSAHLQAIRDDTQQIRNRAFHYTARLFAAMAQSKYTGVLFFMDDIQWADNGSLSLIEHVIKASPNHPFFIIGLARPPLEWGQELPGHMRLELPLLSHQDSLQLVANILRKVPQLPAELPEMIAVRAEGNPFYIEELVRMLIEDKVIVTEGHTWQIAPERLAAANIPATLTGVLQAGLDGLTSWERETLERAAVIGRIFWDRAVTHLAAGAHMDFSPDSASTTAVALGALRQKGIILKHKEANFAGTEEYSFKHSILHEVTYEGTLRRRQRAYHARAAEWFINQSGERATEYAGLIAGHLERAGENERAAVYLRQAGEQAAAQFANETAVSYFTQALALIPEHDRMGRYDLLLSREKVLGLQGFRDAQKEDLTLLADLAASLGHDQKQAQVMLRQSYLADLTGDYTAAMAAAESAIHLAQTAQEPTLEALGCLHWGTTLWRLGKHDEARTRLEQSLALARTLKLPQVEADSLRMIGNVFLREAKSAEADDYYRQSLEICRRIGDRKGEASALSNMGIIARQLEDDIKAAAYYEEALRLSREIGFRSSQSVLLNNLAVIFSGKGDYSQSKNYYEQSLLIKEEIGDREGEALVLANLGLTYDNLNDHEIARDYSERAIQIARELGARHVQANALTNLGTTLIALGELTAAAAAFQEALDIRHALTQSNLMAQPLAGLARVSLVAGDRVQALAHTETILDYLADHALEGALDPFRIHLTCYQVLQANEDARAAAMLERIYDDLQAQAAKINDPEIRRSFLENVPAHREIVAAWKEQA